MEIHKFNGKVIILKISFYLPNMCLTIQNCFLYNQMFRGDILQCIEKYADRIFLSKLLFMVYIGLRLQREKQIGIELQHFYAQSGTLFKKIIIHTQTP